MALYTISDLHLPLGVNKPMDVFGPAWQNYVSRLGDNWNKTIKEDDTVVLPGDFSWGMRLEEAAADLQFVEALPGRKILLRGNHDYWWATPAKMQRFFSEIGIKSIFLLQNNAFLYESRLTGQRCALCGSRFWQFPAGTQLGPEDHKIYLRELARVQLSLQAGAALEPDEILFFSHYPPILQGGVADAPFIALMERYGVKHVIYGHIHGDARNYAFTGTCQDIRFDLVSCDFLQFMPLKLKD